MCLLEAMAAGKPVVATRVGSVDEIVIPEKTGLMVDAGDVDGLERAIRRVLNDHALADRLARAGHAHVSAEFSAAALAKRYAEIYEAARDRRMYGGATEKPRAERSIGESRVRFTGGSDHATNE